MDTKHVFICTPAKGGKPDGSLAEPFRMEVATLELICEPPVDNWPERHRAIITNRSGKTLELDNDALRALGFLLHDLESKGMLK